MQWNKNMIVVVHTRMHMFVLDYVLYHKFIDSACVCLCMCVKTEMHRQLLYLEFHIWKWIEAAKFLM